LTRMVDGVVLLLVVVHYVHDVVMNSITHSSCVSLFSCTMTSSSDYRFMFSASCFSVERLMSVHCVSGLALGNSESAVAVHPSLLLLFPFNVRLRRECVFFFFCLSSSSVFQRRLRLPLLLLNY
jgi:hypothetical protein